MPIVGGLDIHRKQITFDYLDTVTGQVCRGQVSPATGCTCGPGYPGSSAAGMPRSRWGRAGWRYVAEELTAAGIQAQNPAAIRDRDQSQPSLDQGTMTINPQKSDYCDHRRMQVRRVLARAHEALRQQD